MNCSPIRERAGRQVQVGVRQNTLEFQLQMTNELQPMREHAGQQVPVGVRQNGLGVLNGGAPRKTPCRPKRCQIPITTAETVAFPQRESAEGPILVAHFRATRQN